MPHVNNVKFPECKFCLLFQHTTENNFGKRKQHLMKKWSIHNEKNSLVSKSSVLAPKHITVNYLLFALSMETGIL